MTSCKSLVLILPKLQPGPGHSVAQVLLPKPSMEPVIGSLISVMTCSKMDCWISKMTALMSKMTCYKSSILALPRLPLLTGLDVENDLQQELDLGTAQAAIPAARPVSHTGALSQADSDTTTTKRRGRPPGSRNKKTLQTEAAIAGAMQALQSGGTQGQRDEALQALQAALQGQDVQDNVGVTQGKKAAQLGQRITLQERRSHRLASDGNGLSGVVRLLYRHMQRP